MKVNSFCEFPFNRVRVTSEGNLSMCCFMRPDPLQNPNDAYIGNVLVNSFDEIWLGELAESIRSETLSGRLHKKCNAPGCPFVSMQSPYPKKEVVYNEHPSFLEIDLPNTHCNVGGISPSFNSPACIMCERSSPFFKPEKNKLFEVLEKIKYIVPNLKQIHIQGIAEPFYETRESNHLLFDILDILQFDKYANQITISVTTNGTLLKKNVIEEYLTRIPHSITNFSIDASTPETFKKIRIFDCFDKVIENLYEFSRRRIRSRQFLRIHNNINTINVNEVIGMVRIAHKANVDYVEFNPTNGFKTDILVNQENCGIFKKAEIDIIDECKKLNVPLNFIRPLDLNMTENLIQITI